MQYLASRAPAAFAVWREAHKRLERPPRILLHRGIATSGRWLLAVAFMLSMAAGLFGAGIKGTITVKQRLTRPSVTASVSVYERGPVVEPRQRYREGDPLAEERAARVVIWVEGHPVGANPGSAAVATMHQVNRRFDPDIVVIPVGGSVTFPNMDPIFHNVFSLSKPKSFDLGNFPKGDTRTVLFPKPGIVFVNCRLHPNMAGVVIVAPNQWFAKADRDGQYSIGDVPPGTYSLVALRTKRPDIFAGRYMLSDGRDSVVDFLVPLDGPVEDSDTGANMRHMKMTSR